VQKTEDLLAEKSRITVADFRDHLSTSRKYAVALLEYMDEHKITRREGDYRIKYAG
jgi:selenocysteine-specific elongation factor